MHDSVGYAISFSLVFVVRGTHANLRLNGAVCEQSLEHLVAYGTALAATR
jgi:hypothetical protein